MQIQHLRRLPLCDRMDLLLHSPKSHPPSTFFPVMKQTIPFVAFCNNYLRVDGCSCAAYVEVHRVLLAILFPRHANNSCPESHKSVHVRERSQTESSTARGVVISVPECAAGQTPDSHI